MGRNIEHCQTTARHTVWHEEQPFPRHGPLSGVALARCSYIARRRHSQCIKPITTGRSGCELPERVAAESDDEDYPEQRYQPGVRLLELSASHAAIADGASDALPCAPFRLLARVEAATEQFLRIVETGSERLITVIEFVSPSNKLNPGLTEFRTKRAELLAAGVNFVEVDLVRQGNWRKLLRPHVCPLKCATTYRVTVRIPSDRAAVGLYPISLRRPLPSIIVPLRPDDPEVRLELQPLVNQAYSNGRYGRRLNYQALLERPLPDEDQVWVRDLLAASG